MLLVLGNEKCHLRVALECLALSDTFYYLFYIRMVRLFFTLRFLNFEEFLRLVLVAVLLLELKYPSIYDICFLHSSFVVRTIGLYFMPHSL